MGEFVRILFGTLFLFMAASAVLGVGCLGAFAGCVVVVDSVLDPKEDRHAGAAKKSITGPVALPSPGEEVVAEPQVTKPSKPRRKKKKVELPPEPVETPDEIEPVELTPPSRLIVPLGFEEDDDGTVRTTGPSGA